MRVNSTSIIYHCYHQYRSRHCESNICSSPLLPPWYNHYPKWIFAFIVVTKGNVRRFFCFLWFRLDIWTLQVEVKRTVTIELLWFSVIKCIRSRKNSTNDLLVLFLWLKLEVRRGFRQNGRISKDGVDECVWSHVCIGDCKCMADIKMFDAKTGIGIVIVGSIPQKPTSENCPISHFGPDPR